VNLGDDVIESGVQRFDLAAHGSHEVTEFLEFEFEPGDAGFEFEAFREIWGGIVSGGERRTRLERRRCRTE